MKIKGMKNKKIATSDEHIWDSTIGWVIIRDSLASFNEVFAGGRFGMTWTPNDESENITLRFNYNDALLTDVYLMWLRQDVLSAIKGDL